MSVNSKNDYEQLKRRNRRRLAGAVALVLIAAVILLLVLNRRPATVSAASEPVVRMPDVQVAGTVSADAASAVLPASDALPLPDLAAPDAASAPASPAGMQNNAGQNTVVTETLPAVRPTVPAEEMRKPQQPETRREPVKTPSKSESAAKQKPAPAKQQPARSENQNRHGLTPEEILNNRAASVMKNAKTAAPAATTAGTGRIIQVGAYSSRSQAEDVSKRLAAAGVSAHVVNASTSKGTVYRVRTGSYRSQDAVQKALTTIRAQGFDGMVMSR